MEGLAWQRLSTTWDYLRQPAKIEVNEYVHRLARPSPYKKIPTNLSISLSACLGHSEPLNKNSILYNYYV